MGDSVVCFIERWVLHLLWICQWGHIGVSQIKSNSKHLATCLPPDPTRNTCTKAKYFVITRGFRISYCMRKIKCFSSLGANPNSASEAKMSPSALQLCFGGTSQDNRLWQYISVQTSAPVMAKNGSQTNDQLLASSLPSAEYWVTPGIGCSAYLSHSPPKRWTAIKVLGHILYEVSCPLLPRYSLYNYC